VAKSATDLWRINVLTRQSSYSSRLGGVGEIMQNVEIWLTPLLLLPGVALLIMSTSARYGQIHAELHHLIEKRRDRVLVSSLQLLTNWI